MAAKRMEVVSNDPAADAERIVRAFARRAFRRAVTDDDLKPLLDLVKARLGDKDTFEQAVRVGCWARWCRRTSCSCASRPQTG